MAPRAEQHRKDGEEAEELGSVLAVFGTDHGPEVDGRSSRHDPGQAFDLGDRKPAYLCGARRSPVGNFGNKIVVAGGVGVDVSVVDAGISHEDVDERKHQGDVGTGQRL